MKTVNNNENQGWSREDTSALILKKIDDAKALYDEQQM